MYRLLRAVLFLIPAEMAHGLGLRALRILGRLRLRERTRHRALAAAEPRAPEPTSGQKPEPTFERGSPGWEPRSGPAGVDLRTRLCGIPLPHPIALAAGLDKDAEAVAGLFALGFSAVEVGTVTPRPQPGNPRPRLFRLPPEQALINRMGFNNHGADALARRLSALDFRPGPVGINLGKNRDTPLERAVEDYVLLVERLAPLADYLVINASSPNTPGLRSLQAPDKLEALLRAVLSKRDEVADGKPLLLKIAPDLAPEAVDEIVDLAVACGVSGLVCTNTTLARPVKGPHADEAGGLSGRPLRAMSTEILRRASARANGRLALVASGGVLTAEDVLEKLRAGASVVQLYTGFVYGGPSTVPRLLKDLRSLLAGERFSVPIFPSSVGPSP